MLESKYQKFYDEIVKKIKKEKIFTDKLHTLAYGTDASFYRLIPKIVIKTDNSIISCTSFALSVLITIFGINL